MLSASELAGDSVAALFFVPLFAWIAKRISPRLSPERHLLIGYITPLLLLVINGRLSLSYVLGFSIATALIWFYRFLPDKLWKI